MGGAAAFDLGLVGGGQRRIVEFQRAADEHLPFLDREGGKFGQDFVEAHAGKLASGGGPASAGCSLRAAGLNVCLNHTMVWFKRSKLWGPRCGVEGPAFFRP